MSNEDSGHATYTPKKTQPCRITYQLLDREERKRAKLKTKEEKKQHAIAADRKRGPKRNRNSWLVGCSADCKPVSKWHWKQTNARALQITTIGSFSQFIDIYGAPSERLRSERESTKTRENLPKTKSYKTVCANDDNIIQEKIKKRTEEIIKDRNLQNKQRSKTKIYCVYSCAVLACVRSIFSLSKYSIQLC